MQAFEIGLNPATFGWLLVGLLVAPVAGGLIAGVDRILTAKCQSRVGPPLLQPFYDAAKLWGKETKVSNVWIAFCSWMYFTAAATSCVMFFLQSDLLIIFFVQAVGAVFLVIGALSVPSPYSQIGGQRELLQIMAYEPLLILVFVGIFLATGSFNISAVYAMDKPLMLESGVVPMVLLFVVLGYALTIKLRKSPFDISGSHHAHQEIVRGVFTEYSGRYLALVEVAHWYEVVLVLGVVALFWATSWYAIVILLVLTYAAEILVDNITARLSWRAMLGKLWASGLALSFVSLAWLYAF